MKRLNLGCGAQVHPDWVNVDHRPAFAGVIRADLRKPLPFGEGEFDAVYASHVLEHFGPGEGARLLGEIRRVLRPGGIARIVVPDLERAARGYLEALEQGDDARHEWGVVELIDQLVRTRGGGEMARLYQRADEPLRRHIAARIGEEISPPASLRARLRAALGRLLGAEADFRRSGEAHRWMYDRRSLPRALLASGFERPRVVRFDESDIPAFAGSGLDDANGKPRKPDSLYVEATRP